MFGKGRATHCSLRAFRMLIAGDERFLPCFMRKWLQGQKDAALMQRGWRMPPPWR